MKKLTILAIVVMSLLLTMTLVAAAPSEANVNNAVNRGEYVFTATNQTATVEAGNITYVDLDTNFSTYRWAGILGDVTGNIVLGDGVGNDILFTWTAKGRVVYATEASTIAWASLTAANTSTIPSYINGGSDSDNFTNTFSGTGTVDSGLYATSIGTVPRATTLGGTSGWYTYALYDGSNVVYAGNVIPAGENAYDGSTTVNYQMIVPESGVNNDATASQYNLWVELQ